MRNLTAVVATGLLFIACGDAPDSASRGEIRIASPGTVATAASVAFAPTLHVTAGKPAVPVVSTRGVPGRWEIPDLGDF